MTVEPKEPSKGIKSKFVSGVKFASRTAKVYDGFGGFKIGFMQGLGFHRLTDRTGLRVCGVVRSRV